MLVLKKNMNLKGSNMGGGVAAMHNVFSYNQYNILYTEISGNQYLQYVMSLGNWYAAYLLELSDTECLTTIYSWCLNIDQWKHVQIKNNI